MESGKGSRNGEKVQCQMFPLSLVNSVSGEANADGVSE